MPLVFLFLHSFFYFFELFARYGDFSWYKGITGAELVEGKDEAQDDHDALGASEFKSMTPASEMLMK